MDPLFKFWILCGIKFALFLLEIPLDFLFGWTLTGGTRKQRQTAENYESSAQIVKILWRAMPTTYRPSRLHYFLYKHEEYVHPEYILNHSNVTLLAVEKEYGLFSMTDKLTNVYDCTKFPFLFLAQHFEPTRLVILPIRSFHRLADELGDPKVPVAMTAMTARCGSTLLAQIFHKVPNTRSMSEPWATVNIHELRSAKKVTRDESRRLLRSAVRLHCKVEPGSNVERIFMKMTVANAPQFKDLGELFPDIKFLFNTRHPVPSVKSMKQVLETAFAEWYDQSGLGYKEWVILQGIPVSYEKTFDIFARRWSKWRQNITDDEVSVVMYAMSMLAYFDNKELYKRIVFYENLSQNPKEEVLKLFDIMGIEHKHLPAALEALKKDSQNGTFGARGKGRSAVLDPQLLELINGYMREMGMPEITHNMSVPDFMKVFEK